MAVTTSIYDHVPELLMKDLNLATASMKMALVDSNYVFDATDTLWADASGDEIAGTGYTTGGAALAGVAISETGGVGKFDANDVSWATATITCRRGILYVVGTVDSKTNPLLAAILFNDAPADVAVVGITFQNIWDALGVMKLTAT